MLPALAPEKGGDPHCGEDRQHLMPLYLCNTDVLKEIIIFAGCKTERL